MCNCKELTWQQVSDVNMLDFSLLVLATTGLPVMSSFLRSGHKAVGMKLFFQLSKALRDSPSRKSPTQNDCSTECGPDL